MIFQKTIRDSRASDYARPLSLRFVRFNRARCARNISVNRRSCESFRFRRLFWLLSFRRHALRFHGANMRNKFPFLIVKYGNRRREIEKLGVLARETRQKSGSILVSNRLQKSLHLRGNTFGFLIGQSVSRMKQSSSRKKAKPCGPFRPLFPNNHFFF